MSSIRNERKFEAFLFAETVSGILAALLNCHLTAMRLGGAVLGQSVEVFWPKTPQVTGDVVVFHPDSKAGGRYGKQNPKHSWHTSAELILVTGPLEAWNIFLILGNISAYQRVGSG